MFNRVDRPFLITVVILVVAGFFIFSSASLGLFARDGARFSSVAFSQLIFGILGGSLALFTCMTVNYKIWRKFAFYIFLATVFATLLVFVPGLGFEFNGAHRWLNIGSFSFQPAELLKLGFVMYFASWLASNKDKVKKSFVYGVLPIVALLAFVGGILLLQPDTGTFLVIISAAGSMYIVGGGRWRDMGILFLVLVLGAALLVFTRPYVKDRLVTFLNPESDRLGSGYQVNQSLIAIGSGGITGRGFGQSVQKFNYLPEPIGDSIFSVAAEEFGFIGALFLIGLFLFLGLRGLKIAARAPDYFGGLLVTGIVILIISQSFINIGAMLGVFPLTGMPLLFVSHGGSALFLTLASIGIILNVSKYSKKTA